MISVSTSFFPFRMKLGRREPVEMTVLIKNNEPEAKMLTYEMMLSRDLGLDKSGLKYGDLKEIPKLNPGEEVKYKYMLYPRQFTNAGEAPIKVKISEHYNSFKYVTKEYVKDESLLVEE